jgi:hypothetical protein
MSSDDYYLTNGAHCLLTGATGAGEEYGGKTVLGNWWVTMAMKNGLHDMGLIFNPKGHQFVRGETVRSLNQLVTAYREGSRLFNYVPTADSAAEHDKVLLALRQTPGSKIVMHDEAHEVADSDMLDWCFRQGGNVGNGTRFRTGDIRSIGVTQHPWDLPESVTNNCPLLCWVGPKTAQSKKYFQAMQIQGAYDEIPNTDPYHWSVIDAGEYVDTNAPVPERFAQ